ncbi:MAG: prephenate dehydratase [Candidatus Omnitrophica bacterium]|nr:prephenate dehydratase [Candidatus Omnitrophota bacterium]
MALEKVRKNIDIIDAKIVELLNKRAQEVLKVNLLKEKNQLAIYAPQREVEILSRLKKLRKAPLSPEDVEIIFREILSVCRSLRTVLRIAYLGPEGTFTQIAAIKQFGKKAEYIPVESISDVFEEIERGRAEYGVVPIENSIEGVINYTLDMFFASNLKICAEVTLNVSHVLLARSRSPIKRIYSKAEVFPQCRKWLSANYPQAELISVSSTARAAMEATKDPHGACIGNQILAALYNLNVKASFIEDSSQNCTRFLVIAKNDSLPSGKDKTSVLFSVKDKVGVLHDVLASFKKYKINLTKIESRPSKKKLWEYYFFVDFMGHRQSLPIKKALAELEKNCVFMKILGSYPKEN